MYHFFHRQCLPHKHVQCLPHKHVLSTPQTRTVSTPQTHTVSTPQTRTVSIPQTCTVSTSVYTHNDGFRFFFLCLCRLSELATASGKSLTCGPSQSISIASVLRRRFLCVVASAPGEPSPSVVLLRLRRSDGWLSDTMEMSTPLSHDMTLSPRSWHGDVSPPPPRGALILQRARNINTRRVYTAGPLNSTRDGRLFSKCNVVWASTFLMYE